MLKLESVEIAYGAIQAVKGVSLEVRQGEVVTIIGANGAGKSTLLKSICGLEPLSRGRILIDGKDVAHLRAHQRVALGVAMSPEGRGVFADQTVRENLMLGGYSRKKDASAMQAAIEREFNRFPRLRERQDQLSGTLSGGEQQMLAIARGLMAEPELLIIDELSLGLAPKIVDQLMRVLADLNKAGLSILLVEQLASYALAIADHAYVIANGRVARQGPSAELARDPEVMEAFLGKKKSAA